MRLVILAFVLLLAGCEQRVQHHVHTKIFVRYITCQPPYWETLQARITQSEFALAALSKHPEFTDQIIKSKIQSRKNTQVFVISVSATSPQIAFESVQVLKDAIVLAGEKVTPEFFHYTTIEEPVLLK